MIVPSSPAPRFPKVLRRLAWVTPAAWILAVVLLAPSIGHGKPVHFLVVPLLVAGALTLVAGIGFCMEDWKAADPEGYRAGTQAAMWAITIVTVVRWMRRH
jgi:hypothetical protein